MGHVINPHLFRLNYTVFWNISLLSKKKFSIFIDLKSLIIYNFFSNYFNNYKTIRKIKLRILKIKISFYCNSAKIFFFFVKHRNLNRNFKKMFSYIKSNKYYIQKLVDLNNSFMLNYNKYLYKTQDKFLENIYEKESILEIKNNFSKKKEKIFYPLIIFNKPNNFFLFAKKNNFLFVKNYKSIMFKNKVIKQPFYFKFFNKLRTEFSLKKLFRSLNLYKNLMYKNFRKIFVHYGYNLKMFNDSQYFNFYNYKRFKEFFQKNINNHYDYRLFYKKKLKLFRRKNKGAAFFEKKTKKKLSSLLNREEYVKNTGVKKEEINEINKISKIRVSLNFFKKSFFFLNIKKKYTKNKNFFTNKYFKYFLKSKKLYVFNRFYRKKISKKKINKNKTNNKKIILNSMNLNRIKNKLDYKMLQYKPNLILNSKSTKKTNCTKILYRKRKRIIINKKNKEDNIDQNKNGDILYNDTNKNLENNIKLLKQKKEIFKKEENKIKWEKYIKKLSMYNWISFNLKNNLKIIRNKFLLFNFVKIFLKLKKKMYNIFNRVYLNSVLLNLTVCLKKSSRWKLTADYLNDLIIVRLKQKYRIKNIMKFVIKYLNKMLKKKKMLGYAILLKGRFSRKDRAVYQLKRFGTTTRANKISILDFSNKSVNLTYSKAAISIWIIRHI